MSAPYLEENHNKESIKTRIEILLHDFIKSHRELGLITLDENRAFSKGQREEIFNRDDSRCRKCLRKLEFDQEWHADHIVPWIKGGKTSIENGQVLCRKHNLEKSDKLWE